MANSITLFYIYKPQFSKGLGRYVGNPQKHTFKNESERKRLIQAGMAYLSRNKEKLELFEIYEHPGNKKLYRWTPEVMKWVKIWIKGNGFTRTEYKPLFDAFYDNTDTLAAAIKEHYYAKLAAGEIWQVRAYLQPGNQELVIVRHEEIEAHAV